MGISIKRDKGSENKNVKERGVCGRETGMCLCQKKKGAYVTVGWSESQAGEKKQTKSVGAVVSGTCTRTLKHGEITAFAAVQLSSKCYPPSDLYACFSLMCILLVSL